MDFNSLTLHVPTLPSTITAPPHANLHILSSTSTHTHQNNSYRPPSTPPSAPPPPISTINVLAPPAFTPFPTRHSVELKIPLHLFPLSIADLLVVSLCRGLCTLRLCRSLRLLGMEGTVVWCGVVMVTWKRVWGGISRGEGWISRVEDERRKPLLDCTGGIAD